MIEVSELIIIILIITRSVSMAAPPLPFEAETREIKI